MTDPEREADILSLMHSLALPREDAEAVMAGVDADALAEGFPIHVTGLDGFATRYTPSPAGRGLGGVLGEVSFPGGGGGAFIGADLAGAKLGLDEIMRDHMQGRK